MSVHAEFALTANGWQERVRIVFAAGRIESVEIGATAQPGDDRCLVVVPGMPNVHSHAFQRAMAGLTEVRGPADVDDFWSWRTEMYRIALAMTPECVEAVASQLYMEMLEAGFCHVGEFHYLHHDTDGTPYTNRAEMACRIVAGAARAGIGLTLLPVFYAHSTFGGEAPSAGQRRFVCDLDEFARLLEESRRVAQSLAGTVVGVAPHSLRAVTPEELGAVVAMLPGGPIHIHAAEQVKEVEDCVAWSGRRPVEWLLENSGVDRRWTLIHATHTTPDELRRLGAAGATVGLCPITEANLGDGIFAAPEFLDAGGRFGIGSDSNIEISLADELRQLEYSQRLMWRSRNVLARPNQSTGQALFEQALRGGGCAIASDLGIAAGKPASVVSLKCDALPNFTIERALDAWIFARSAAVDAVWSSGQKVVSDGRHVRGERIAADFNAAMRRCTT